MRNVLIKLSILAIIFTACSPFSGPRNVDWKKEWDKNQTKLKALVQDILEKGSENYTTGNNDFPSDFDYPFDDGFVIESNYSGIETIDSKKLTIKFYVDRGLLDHYSAIIYTNDSAAIHSFEMDVENGGNDFKIEPNWYMMNE